MERKNVSLLWIDDTTLRDGEQTAGVVFANAEKIQIAKMLGEVGVHQIEVGIPAMGGDEKEAIKSIVKLNLPTSILAWNRAVTSDIDASLDCGVDTIAVSISASDIHIQTKLQRDRQWVLDSIKESVDYAKRHNLYVSVNAEDASRADPEFMIQFATAAKESGADRIRYCDTLGILDPFETYSRIKALIDAVNIDVEMHTHNDLGMATANALAGIRAGAKYVNVTVNGLGERAGNAALEEVVMALKYIEGIDVGIDTSRFRELSEYVARASGRPLPTWKPVVGSNLFVYESEGRASGALQSPTSYEIYPPDEVGLARKFIIGKHSGVKSVRNKLRQYGLRYDDVLVRELTHEARSLAIKLKRALFDQELIELYQQRAGKITAQGKTRKADERTSA
ncbi:MAG: homocitrate synthase [Dehalococcoidales bacterium]|nr:homocitrate synthase [Dehalococcoidales bacterium]